MSSPGKLSGRTFSLNDFSRLTAPMDVSSMVYIVIRSETMSPKVIRVTSDTPVKPVPVIDLTCVVSTTTRVAKTATTR